MDAPDVDAPPCWRSDDLLHGGREVHIAHAGSVYRLRVTGLGKLILTK
jgi:hemin uptake protein HemP